MASSTMEEVKLPGGYLVTPRVPQGLAAAVEGLTREVIRHAPEDIYVFAAHHFENLLKLREKCNASPIGNREEGIETLKEMSRALRNREVERENSKVRRAEQPGWSLNQTAKVLKRHRSIFGEEARRISTDEVFQMAEGKSPEKENSSPRKGDKEPSEFWKASTSRTENSREDEANRGKTEAKIISRMTNLTSGKIMLAKDIKSELRKNRISSKERRKIGGRSEEKSASEKSMESGAARSGDKNNSSRRSNDNKERKTEAEAGKHARKHRDSSVTRSLREQRRVIDKSRDEDSSSRNEGKTKKIHTPGMDRVKEYVVEKFATARSLEELQSSNYVEKVQEIIDETGPIIKDKVEQLKSGVIGRSDKNNWIGNARRNRESDESRRRDSGGNSTSESSRNEALRARLTETQSLLENVSSSLARRSRRSKSARSLRRSEKLDFSERVSGESGNSSTVDAVGLESRLSRTRDLLEEISATLSKPVRRSSSAKNLSRSQESPDEASNGDILRKRLDETRKLLKGISASFGKSVEKCSRRNSQLELEGTSSSEERVASSTSLPAVKSSSTKNSSTINGSRSGSENLVLPAISPEAPKSSKIKENLILPVLSPPGTASTNEDSNKIIDTNDDLPLEDFGIPKTPAEDDDSIREIPVEDVSRDSLNVTPDMDDAPQRPDSLEPPQLFEESDKGIRSVEKNVENVFGPRIDVDVQHFESFDMREKLQELHNAEKIINKILSGENVSSDDRESEAIKIQSEIKNNLSDIEKNNEEIKEPDNKEKDLNCENDDSHPDKMNRKETERVSPKLESYTYVLTEGSPHDIPDTVTTVIIPEKNLDSLESDELRIELEDGEEARCSLISIENVRHEEEINKEEEKEVNKVLQRRESLEKGLTDSFGEFIPPEVNFNSGDLNFIQEIEEIKISHQDLVPINEEVPEELEDLEDKIDVVEIEEISNENEKVNDEEETFEDVEMKIEEEEEIVGNNGIKVEEEISMSAVEITSDENVSSRDKEIKMEDEFNMEDNEMDGKEIKDENIGMEGDEMTVVEEISKVVEDTTSDKEIASEDKVIEVESKIQSKIPEMTNTEEISLEDEEKIKSNEEITTSVENSKLEEDANIAVDDKIETESNLIIVEEETPATETVGKVEIEEAIELTGEEAEVEDKIEAENDVVDVKEQMPEMTGKKIEIKEAIESRTEEIEVKEKIETETNETEIEEQIDSLTNNMKIIEEILMTEEMSSRDENPVEETIVASVKEEVKPNEKENEDSIEGEDKELANENIKSGRKIEKEDEKEEIKIEESDISPDATRPEIDSESSNEAKESSVADEGLESTKQENSLDEEEQSSVSGTPESSNEIKETTLTDGPSFSLDPTRPFVPELNLDSLQDITISSFKMTEDDCEARERGGSENTNSITDETLTSDENHRLSDKLELLEETELVPSSSRPTETVEKIKESAEEIVEMIEGKPVVIKEEICKKMFEETELVPLSSRLTETVEKTEEPGEEIVEEMIEKEQVVIKEEICKKSSAYVTGPSQPEEAEIGTEEKSLSENESQTTQKTDAETPIKTERDEETSIDVPKEETANARATDSDEEVAKIILGYQYDDGLGAESTEEKSEELMDEKDQIKQENEEKTEYSSEKEFSEGGKNEEIEDNPDSDKLLIQRSSEGHEEEMDGREEKSEQEIEMEESPNAFEESLVEEETPLAVSRSASQCTTRRVSSGNLTRLREDPSLGWTFEREGDESDPSSSKVKFSGVEENQMRDSKEFHIYVPEVDTSEQYSTTESSTFDSAVTKIQAGVRGFLTRRRLQRGQQNRSSTLSSIPSIQDSIAIEAEDVDKTGAGDAGASADVKTETTLIPIDYRGHRTRKRLRREDAVQRTTLSLEKSFAENGLQHTGEFHDCIPLPIHEISIDKKPTSLLEDSTGTEQSSHFGENNEHETSKKENIDADEESKKTESDDSAPRKMFFGQATPILQFVRPKVSQLVDLILAKEEAALQTGYLNFITSVEDTPETIIPEASKNFQENPNLDESLREPLALSGPPGGLVIEEITSSYAEKLVQPENENASSRPQETKETFSDLTVPGESNEDPKVDEKIPESCDPTPKNEKHFENRHDSDESGECGSNAGSISNKQDIESPKIKMELNVDPEECEFEKEKRESNITATPQDLNFSLEKDLLGPETSVDSMECPISESEEKLFSVSSDGRIEGARAEEAIDKIPSPEIDSLDRPEVTEERKREESIGSNLDDASSKLSFSIKVEDILGLSSEDSVEYRDKKPILEITLKPGSKSTSLMSQESQLAGERIESPITMMQIAPGRSESLRKESTEINDDEEEETERSCSRKASPKAEDPNMHWSETIP